MAQIPTLCCAVLCLVLLLLAQAVRDHPFTLAWPAVQQCLQEDLQRLQDHHSAHPSSASEGGFRCLQRRLVLPACAAHALEACPADVAAASDAARVNPSGSSSKGCDGASTAADVPQGGWDAGDHPLQQQSSARSASGRLASGWLARAGDSSSGGSMGPGSGWRSYRRRLAPSCRELMFVCDGDRNGVIHYIATGDDDAKALTQLLFVGSAVP
jgi:hypothetical protein